MDDRAGAGGADAPGTSAETETARLRRRVAELEAENAALHASEERHRLAVQAVEGMVYDWDVRTGQVERSDGLRGLLGYAPEEAEATDAWWGTRVHPDDAALLGPPADRAARYGGARFAVEARVRHRDGHWVDVLDTGYVIRDADGRPVRVVGTSVDVTERKRARHALRDSEARFRTLAESIEDVFYITDLDRGALTYLSPAYERVWGRPAAELLADLRLFEETLHPADRPTFATAKDEQARGERVVMEYRIVRPDGSVRWILDRCFPIGGGPQEPGRGGPGPRLSAGVATDVTTRRQAEGALRASERRLQTMVAELQHRTRNLIAVVRSIAGQTMESCGTLDGFRDQFGARMAALARVQGLLSRAEQEPITIGTLLRMELDALGVPSVGADGRIVLEGPEVRLRNSAVQTVALALHELATNARKHGVLADAPGAVAGSLAVTWRLEEDGEDLRLVLEWVERRAGPADAPPSDRVGYGRELIEEALPYALNARTRFELDGAGVRCVIDLPLHQGSGGYDGEAESG